jgi:hypothetical protein
MGVRTSEVGYTSATNGRGNTEVQKGHVVALGGKNQIVQQFDYFQTGLNFVAHLSYLQQFEASMDMFASCGTTSSVHY